MRPLDENTETAELVATTLTGGEMPIWRGRAASYAVVRACRLVRLLATV